MPLIAALNGATQMGWSRRHSEDRLLVAQDDQVCAVLDGCGGRGLPADAILESLYSLLTVRDRPITLDSLENAVRLGEASLMDTVERTPSLKGCGTTLLLALLDSERLMALHVGDSRLYRLRNGTLTQLSTDHTWMAQLIAAGQLTPEEAHTHPLKNVVTRAIGGSRHTPIDLIQDVATPGDFYFLCTDGLWRETSDDAIREALITFGSNAVRPLLTATKPQQPNRIARCADDATIAILSVAERGRLTTPCSGLASLAAEGQG